MQVKSEDKADEDSPGFLGPPTDRAPSSQRERQRNLEQEVKAEQTTRMEDVRGNLSVALNRFCHSAECASFEGEVRPDSALQLVNKLVAAASKRLPAYTQCQRAEGKEPTPGENHLRACACFYRVNQNLLRPSCAFENTSIRLECTA